MLSKDIDKPVGEYKDRLTILKNKTKQPWLVWLSWLSAGLQTRRSPVQFPVRAQARVASQVPSWGVVRGNRLMILSHTSAPKKRRLGRTER